MPKKSGSTARRTAAARKSPAVPNRNATTQRPTAGTTKSQSSPKRDQGGDTHARLEAISNLLVAAVERFAEAAQRIEQEMAQLRHAARDYPPEAFERVAKVFTGELHAMLGDDPPDDDTVRRAARQTFAEQAWERRLGGLVDANDVASLLGVSRQHVHTLATQHRLIALSQDGKRAFPAWQFAGTNTEQRTCLAAAHRELVETGHLSPWSAASWMQADHPELDDQDPVAFLRSGGDCARMRTAASRDAARVVQ